MFNVLEAIEAKHTARVSELESAIQQAQDAQATATARLTKANTATMDDLEAAHAKGGPGRAELGQAAPGWAGPGCRQDASVLPCRLTGLRFRSHAFTPVHFNSSAGDPSHRDIEARGRA